MNDIVTCPKCGSTNLVRESRAILGGAADVLRCRPGCETVWGPEDLMGARFDYLHEHFHPTPASAPLPEGDESAPDAA